eukprot:jgi/Bigna1/89130/estExt_fgenesh1_pg.C_440063
MPRTPRTFSHASRAYTRTRELTENWVKNWIVRENLCPFAKPLLDRPNALRIATSLAANNQELLTDFKTEVNLLKMRIAFEERSNLMRTNIRMEDQGQETVSGHLCPEWPESTLLVVDNSDTDYLHTFHELILTSYDLQKHILEDELLGHLQIVLFHPNATHSLYSESSNDNGESETLIAPKSFAIRSPFPTIHLLREKDIMAGVQGGLYKQPELIPARNAATLEKMEEEARGDNRGGVQMCWKHAVFNEEC